MLLLIFDFLNLDRRNDQPDRTESRAETVAAVAAAAEAAARNRPAPQHTAGSLQQQQHEVEL